MDGLGDIIQQIIELLGKRTARIVLIFICLAAVAKSINIIYVDLGAPIYRFTSTHNFAFVLHHLAGVWTDILVVLVLVALILFLGLCVGIVGIWFVLAFIAHYIILPIVNAFKKKVGENPVEETVKPLAQLGETLPTSLEKI